MDPTDRRMVESPLYIGEDESLTYGLDVSNWGSSPTGVAVVLKDSDGTDVSSSNLTGSASVSGDVITLPAIHSLTADAAYRLEVAFTISGNDAEAWIDVYGQE